MISIKEMIELEKRAVAWGIPLLNLMENAGKGFVEKVSDICKGKRVVIFCGHGNNGGDGLVIARYLCEICDVFVFFVGKKESMTDLTKENMKRLPLEVKLIEHLDTYDVCIDAMLGTGVKGNVREPYHLAIIMFNELDGKKICVDVPSGVDPDTGDKADVFCQCDLLITFHDIKRGLVEYKEKTTIVDIGIPRSN